MKKIVLIVVLTGVLFMSTISGVIRISSKPMPGIEILKFQKCALVIGNQDYLDTKLNSPVDDANKMATALKEFGFEVILLNNLSKTQMEEALQRFSDSLPTTGVCLFYFSGLGLQHNGSNYLMPVDVAQQNSKDTDLSNRCVAVDKVIQTMGDSHLLTKVLIFDTEFNDPGHENKSQNLWINLPRETIISFATTPGRHALDGIDSGSPYTRNLLESLSKQGQTIEEVFKEAAKKVANESEGEQVPFMLSTLTRGFYPNHPADAGSEADAGKPVESSTDGTGVALQPINWEPEMVFIKGGSFMMGSEEDNDEKPPHIVVVNDFYMGKYEITQAQWQVVMGSNPSYNKGCDNCPVEQVSWNDVQEFITKLNQKTGKSYYLPTEAEWEYAAGGGKAHQKWAGTKNESTLERYAWIESNSGGKTNPVGKRSPNLFGLYDMTGNVWEWCADWRKGYPGSSGVTDCTNAGRVIRGGSWYSGTINCRVAYRNSYAPDGRHNLGIGFRLVLVP